MSTPATIDVIRQPSVLIWTMLSGIGLAFVLALAPGVEGDRLVHFGLSAILIEWILVGTLGIITALERLLERLSRRWQLCFLILTLPTLTFVAYMVAAWLLQGAGYAFDEPPSTGAVRASLIALTFTLLGVVALLNHLRAQDLLARAKQAELEALRARTNPHFLFNTLNTGAALVHAKPEAAESLLLDLADLFRASLSGPDYVALAHEMDLVERYLSIEQLRLGDRLRVRRQLPDPLPAVDLPILSIQPLVENAIRHGIERLVDGGAIDLAITTGDDRLSISVRNDVPESNASDAGGHGIGLAAVAHRIEAMTEGQGRLATAYEGAHHIATISIPIKRTGQ